MSIVVYKLWGFSEFLRFIQNSETVRVNYFNFTIDIYNVLQNILVFLNDNPKPTGIMFLLVELENCQGTLIVQSVKDILWKLTVKGILCKLICIQNVLCQTMRILYKYFLCYFCFVNL